MFTISLAYLISAVSRSAHDINSFSIIWDSVGRSLSACPTRPSPETTPNLGLLRTISGSSSDNERLSPALRESTPTVTFTLSSWCLYASNVFFNTNISCSAMYMFVRCRNIFSCDDWSNCVK
uniref:ORF23 n=1 Tax=Malaco herpesvirus 4 TaxID=3031800 RepID=A0AA48P7V0_9VIRU|nr:TPA_asm: ORF23 [Malaco herpesvirus 4]